MINIDNKFKNIQVFVYCGGKCGSTTLTKTMKQYFSTIHVHNNEDFPIEYKLNNKYSIFDVIDYNKNNYDNIYIIYSYRTPIERKISSFFNNISTLHLPNYKKCKLRDIIYFFNNKKLKVLEEYHSINEIMEYYNVPLFEEFDFKHGYNIVKKDNINFIKLRFNDINKWDKILSEIFKRNISIVSDNISDNKEYSKIYTAFKKYYFIPREYFNTNLPNDINFKIYNTEEEQQEYYKKWEQRLLEGF